MMITTVYADGRKEQREMTADEVAALEARQAEIREASDADKAAEEAWIAARASARVKLTALGLTEEEAAAIIK